MPESSKKLVWNNKGAEIERCGNFFLAKIQKNNEEYKIMDGMFGSVVVDGNYP